jgi:hypothetical protein
MFNSHIQTMIVTMMWNNLINDSLIPFLASPLNSGTSYNTGFDKKYVGQVVILPFCAGCHIGRHVEYHVLGSFGLIFISSIEL